MTNELHIPQIAIFLSRLLLAWLGLLRLDFTAAVAGLCCWAIKNPLFPQIFGKNFCKNFSNSLLILINPDSLIKGLSVYIINNNKPQKFFANKFFGLKPPQDGSRFNKIAQLAWTRLWCSRLGNFDPVMGRKPRREHAWNYPFRISRHSSLYFGIGTGILFD